MAVGTNLSDVAELVLALVAIVGVPLGFYQLAIARSDQEAKEIIEISENTADHNSEIFSSTAECAIVANILGLSAPPSGGSACSEYWAERSIHLRHTLLVWRVWELASRKKYFIFGETIIKRRFEGWERFARVVVAQNLMEADIKRLNGSRVPSEVAASDLWRGLGEYEPHNIKFVLWLKALAER